MIYYYIWGSDYKENDFGYRVEIAKKIRKEINGRLLAENSENLTSDNLDLRRNVPCCSFILLSTIPGECEYFTENGKYVPKMKYYGSCGEQAKLLARACTMIGIHAQPRHVYGQKGTAEVIFSENESGALRPYIEGLRVISIDENGLSDDELAKYLRMTPEEKKKKKPRKPFWNGGHGCCCIPKNNDNQKPGYSLSKIKEVCGTTNDDYAAGCYVLAMVGKVTKLVSDSRGDIEVLKWMKSKGFRMRWKTMKTPEPGTNPDPTSAGPFSAENIEWPKNVRN
jgi:hypothetical protein